MSRKRCPRAGVRVCFSANPAARAVYGKDAPRDGECGVIRAIPVGFAKQTCMPGPGGGMVYVDWDKARFMGVFRQHLDVERTGRALGRRRRR